MFPFALLPALTATYLDFDSEVRLHIPRAAFEIGGLSPLRIWELCQEVNLQHRHDLMENEASTSSPFFVYSIDTKRDDISKWAEQDLYAWHLPAITLMQSDAQLCRWRWLLGRVRRRPASPTAAGVLHHKGPREITDKMRISFDQKSIDPESLSAQVLTHVTDRPVFQC